MVVGELSELVPLENPGEDLSSWPVDRVIDRIVDHHHAYVRRQIPVVSGYLAKLVTAKGDRYPVLFRLQEIFATLARELRHHMEKEETIVFPFIRAIAESRARGAFPRMPLARSRTPFA